MLLHFGNQTLPCSIQQHILQLEPWLLPAHLCPCHHIPMQPSCTQSSMAAAHAAASAAAADAGSMAALLMLPEAAPWSCSISGQPVTAPVSACPSDARTLQLGRHTQLTMSPTPATAAAAAAASKLPGPAGGDASRLCMLQALVMAPGQPCELSVQHMTHPCAVDSMLLYGMPLLLTPTASSSSSCGLTAAAVQDAGAAGVKLRDQGLSLCNHATGVSAIEAGTGHIYALTWSNNSWIGCTQTHQPHCMVLPLVSTTRACHLGPLDATQT
jgi:hypothetical protein